MTKKWREEEKWPAFLLSYSFWRNYILWEKKRNLLKLAMLAKYTLWLSRREKKATEMQLTENIG